VLSVFGFSLTAVDGHLHLFRSSLSSHLLCFRSTKLHHEQELEAMKARLAAMEADAAKLRGEEVGF